MAVTWKNGGTINVSSGQSGTISNYAPNAAGNLLVIFSRGGVTTDTFSVSDGTNTWSAIFANDNGDGSNTHDSRRAENISSTTVTVTVDASANNVGHSLRSVMSEFNSGVANWLVLNDSGKNNATQTSSTVTTAGTSTNSGDLVWSAVGLGGNVTFSAGSGYTLEEVVPAAGTSRCADEWKAATGSGSQTATFTWGGTSFLYDEHIASFAATGSGGGGGPAAVLSQRTVRGVG